MEQKNEGWDEDLRKRERKFKVEVTYETGVAGWYGINSLPDKTKAREAEVNGKLISYCLRQG